MKEKVLFFVCLVCGMGSFGYIFLYVLHAVSSLSVEQELANKLMMGSQGLGNLAIAVNVLAFSFIAAKWLHKRITNRNRYVSYQGDSSDKVYFV